MSAKSLKKKSVSNASSKREWLPIIILVITTFLYYGNTLKNGYSLDDDLVTSTDVSKHERVEKGIAGIPEIFTTHYVTNKKQRYDYRPVATSSFALEYDLTSDKSVKNRAYVSHFVNLVLYAIIIVLIYFVIRKLLRDEGWTVPFFTAFIFLIHPIHSEVVNNIKCRDELLVMFFGLLAIINLLKYIDGNYKKLRYVIYAAIFMFAGVLSKSTAQIFIVGIPLILYFFREISFKKLAIIFGVLVLTLISTRVLEKQVLLDSQLRDLMFFENPLAYSESFMERVPMFFYTNFFYLKMMVIPAPLVYYYGYNQIPIADWSYIEVWIGLILVCFVTLFAVVRIRKKEIWAFGILFFLLGIGGAANLLFPAVGIVAERFLFIGSFGLIFLVAYYGMYFYNKMKKKGLYVFYAIGSMLIILSFLQVTNRNEDWNTRFSLYRNDIKHLDKSAKAHSLLGTEYTAVADSISRMQNSSYSEYQKYIDSAISEFTTSLSIYNGYYNAANNAGALYFTRKKNYYKAKGLFKNAIENNPEYVEALFNYGNCFDYDLKGINELKFMVEKSAIDSLVLDEFEGSGSDYLVERKASFAVHMIKNEIRAILNNANVNTPNLANIIVYKIILSLNSHLEIENGGMKARININDFERNLRGCLEGANQSNVKQKLQLVMSYSQSMLFQNLSNYLEIRSKAVSNYYNIALRDLQDLKDGISDSAELFWNKSLVFDPTYYYSYKALITMYINDKKFDDFMRINLSAIENGGFDDNTEFYVNVANVYNTQSQISKSIENMEKALIEVDKVYARVYGDEYLEEQNKQATLFDLMNRKKQIMGFVINIAYAGGDFVTSAKYQNLLSKM